MYRISLLLLAPAITLCAQGSIEFHAPATLPVSFLRTVSAASAKPGDPVEAITIQRVRAPVESLPKGTRVVGHVIEASRFAENKTPYAKQKPGTLTVHFDAVFVKGERVPLSVSVRALAGPIAVADSADPASTSYDPLSTRTQIGGDRLVPSQVAIRNRKGEPVAFNRRDGVFARLIAQGDCDASSEEVSVAMFSANACGLYGFGDAVATERGSIAKPSSLTLVSAHGSPQIWKHSVALLEILPTAAVVSAR